MIKKIKRSIKRYLGRKIQTQRSFVWPFISGDAFRSIANHIHDDLECVKPEKVELGDIIFVCTDFFEDFINNYDPLIKNSYILICHNSDKAFDEIFSLKLNSKIFHCFAQNTTVTNNKITPLPIGIKNIRTDNSAHILSTIQERAQIPEIKKNNILRDFGYGVQSIERLNAENILSKQILSIRPSKWLTVNEYLYTLKNFKFVFSPRGNGLDCHRSWEALYLKTIPIVKNEIFYQYFKKIGIPFICLNSWEESINWGNDDLQKKYHDAIKKQDSNGLYLPFWFDLIRKKQKLIIQK